LLGQANNHMGRGLTRSSPAWMVGLGPAQKKKKKACWAISRPNLTGLDPFQPSPYGWSGPAHFTKKWRPGLLGYMSAQPDPIGSSPFNK